MALHDLGRYILIGVNIIFTACGLGIAAAGIFLLVQAEQLESDVELLQDLPITETSYVLMMLGFALAITSVIGAVGAFKKQRIMLTVYLFVIFALVLVRPHFYPSLTSTQISTVYRRDVRFFPFSFGS